MRILIVSNRLPFTVISDKTGKLRFQQSPGGLASGLSSYLDSLRSSHSKQSYLWIGWPGRTIEQKLQEELKSTALKEYNAYPVLLSEKAMEKFYYGFCNKVIWPLFHYFSTYVTYDDSYWAQYKEVNKIFRDAILEIVKPNDILWIHDYHLMLLPKLIKESAPELPIGFFLHIPFPSFEIFRLLPARWRREILEGLLGADLIGFHTYDYTQYFLRCVMRILGYEHHLGQINIGDRIIKVNTFPMGINFRKFNEALDEPGIKREIDKLKGKLQDFKVVLSIDRLDYTKGIINRLYGYETFLRNYPEWRGRVVLLLIVVPSRVGVEHYQQAKRQIEEMVGRINGAFGTMNWTPIIYLYRFLPFAQLVTNYGISDVALITPLRDGMNLIAKEYIATRKDGTGVLILSEMAGASRELTEAIIINPNDINEIADALNRALEMPEDEQRQRNRIMQDRLKNFDVNRWANDFISELISLKDTQNKLKARLMTEEIRCRLMDDYRKSKKRLIFLDYDGTLVPFAQHPRLAKPTDEIISILNNLSSDPKNETVLISGRDKETLQEWFGNLNISMVAEHGVWIRERKGEWKLMEPLTNTWKEKIRSILEIYADMLPGAFVEEKDYSIVWHYRAADPELGSIRARELIDELINFTANMDIHILQGSKIVEVRNAGVNKGTAGLYWISKNIFDFILAIGDDWTDEDLFKLLPESAYSIRVGLTHSFARFNLKNYFEVRKLLEELVFSANTTDN